VAATLPADRESLLPAITNQFLTHLPRVRAHAHYALRRVHCPDIRSDLMGEILALAWKHFRTLVQRGKDPTAFIATLALRCSQAVKAGRRLVGSDRSKDVMSPVARLRHGFEVGSLDDQPREDDDLAEALADNTRSEVPDQAAFRIDFPRWRRRLGVRNRRVMDALMTGEGTNAVAERFGLSQARVSQLRREFHESWEAFHEGEDDDGLVEVECVEMSSSERDPRRRTAGWWKWFVNNLEPRGEYDDDPQSIDALPRSVDGHAQQAESDDATGSLLLAAFIGLGYNSWWAFGVAGAILLALNVFGGHIRLAGYRA
jgi:DNA-directed RNA polymerase specialized sigma24 family protein